MHRARHDFDSASMAHRQRQHRNVQDTLKYSHFDAFADRVFAALRWLGWQPGSTWFGRKQG